MQVSPERTPHRHRRQLRTILSAPLRLHNYTGVARTFLQCDHPVDFLRRYVFRTGDWPATMQLRTPVGPISLQAYTADDVQTINEIFFRGDYEAAGRHRTIVDFGSNIGISAAYFLSRDPEAYCYCFEPLAFNVQRLKQNLSVFEGRYEVAMCAVGETDGTVQFGWEPTGRYGGVGRDTGHMMIEVPCVDSNASLERVIEERGQIDLLKIDIETLEEAVTKRIPVRLARRIETIVVEFPFAKNPLAETHAMRRNNLITTFTRA